MPSVPRILERLPSLYRPEPGYDDDDLLLQLINAVGAVLDQLSQSSAEIMQAHWYPYADSAVYSNWVGRVRALTGAGPLARNDPFIDQFPYLADLPRIAALVDLSPWREPLRDRERVEAFRERIRRIVRLHRDGLGTVQALRTMTMAALPQTDPQGPAGLRERSFTVEEFTGTAAPVRPIAQPGTADDRVGPLMRWALDSQSLFPVAPTIVIQGTVPETDRIDPTSQPIIERFDPASGIGVGIHYQGDLAPDQALALVPAYQSWLGGETGIALASRVPAGLEPVNPTAPGPWTPAPGAPVGAVADLQQTADHYLWAALNSGGVGSLWRSDGTAWLEVLGGLPELHCLLPAGNTLVVGGASGLSRIEIQPAGGFTLNPDPAVLDDPPVHALVVDAAGTLWAATSRGLAREEAGVLVYTELGARPETVTALRCLLPDPSGVIFCGGDLGLLQYRPASGRWFILRGEAVDEAVNDWLPLDLTGGGLPPVDELFVPPVNALARDPAGGIWLGTDQGIARYRAREQRRAYTTMLEALPELTEAVVHRIAPDARQRLWFACAQGLLVYDGLDWFQRRDTDLVRLPRRVEQTEQPVFWRYQRGSGIWQFRAVPGSGRFADYTGSPLTSVEPPVLSIAWTARAQAFLGSFDGHAFTVDAGAVPAPLGMRFKPSALRIVDGGIPAVPQLVAGTSHWRYLQREEADPPTPATSPAWTREGRLLPPPTLSAAPYEGRYLAELLALGAAVFAFSPAARVWFQWQPREPLAVTVRLARTSPDEHIDPLILDRVWNELRRVKPAGVTVCLAVDEETVRGL